LAAAVLLGFVGAGATPLSPYFSFSYFWPDARSATASALLRRVPDAASIQAPHVLLPHLAERQTLHQASPPERAVDLWVLDVSHRTQYAGSGTLLRTAEEPHVRDFMARADRGVVFYEPPFLLLRRGADPRAALSPFFDATPAQTAPPPQPLCACLSVTHASPHASPQAVGIRLHFVATAACPPDLALRVGESERPMRVDLLFQGAASPVHLRPGDRVFSDHAELRGPVYVGALRSSGAAPEPSDPRSVLVPLVEE
jgi:hypothetical protein